MRVHEVARRKFNLTITLTLGIMGWTVQVAAQGTDTTVIARTSERIVLDGRPDESAWQGASAFGLVMAQPTAGEAPSERSDIRLLHDDDYLYAAGWFYVTETGTIAPGLFTRDAMVSEDHFMLILNATNDEQSGHVFAVAPSGARTDFAISADGAALDRSWNGHWDARSTQDDQGWYSEMRIPLSSLRFESRDGRTTMGLILHRYISARGEFDTYPLLPPEFANALFRSSIAAKILLVGIGTRSPLYVSPYMVGGLSSTARQASPEQGYHRDRTTTREVGLDAKFGLSSSLTVDLTLNTDFAQAEADAQQVNLSRFSLFFPERRQFFLERADLFRVSSGGPDLLFHSRRIGLSSTGTPLRIYGGGRISGRSGGWDLGAMSMQTEGEQSDGSINASVVRVRRAVASGGSYVGVIGTARFESGGGSNTVAGLDADLRIFGNDYVKVQGVISHDVTPTSTETTGGLFRAEWQRRASRGLYYQAVLREISRDFLPRLGFHLRSGASIYFGTLGYGWYPSGQGKFVSVDPQLLTGGTMRTADGVTESAHLTGSLSFNLRSGHRITFLGRRAIENPPAPFTIGGGALIPAGEHLQYYGRATFTSNTRSEISWAADVTVGDYYDGSQRQIAFGLLWNPSAHLILSGDASLVHLEFPTRDQEVNADIVRFRAQYAYNTNFSGDAFLQYNRVAGTVGSNMRLRYQFAEGRDLWLVYNDVLNADREPPEPGMTREPLSQSRTLLVKYVHTLAW